MKKRLLLFTLCTSFILSMSAQKSVQLYPRSSFVGITQKGNTYTKQSIEKDPKHFFVGYNTSTQTYARGYLEFDLSKIPTDAKITSAALRLSGNAGSYPNFGGKIRIERAALGLAYAGEGEWGMLKLIGSGNDGIGIQATFTDNPSDIQYVGGNYLTGCLNDSKGKKVAFMIVHLDSNKLIYLSGTNETLYVDITYTEAPPKPNPPIIIPPSPPAGNTGGNTSTVKNGDSYPIPSRILSGDTLTLGFNVTGDLWKFKKVEYNASQLFEISRGKGYVKFRVRDIIGSERAIVTIAIESKFALWVDTKSHEYSFPINGTPIINSNIFGYITCPGELVEYRIDNFLGKQSDITWQAGTNMTFISASGEYATFRASGKGYGTVKAKVNDKGKLYDLQSSNMWIGAPPQVTPSGAVADGGVLRAGGTYSWGYSRLNNYSFTPISYSWNGVEYTNKPVITYTIPTNATYFSIGLRIKNICGWSSEVWTRYTVTATGTPGAGGGGPPELRSLSVIEQPEIKSVKVYNLSGVLVYSDNAVNGSFDIKSTVLNDGIYIIEKFDGENRTSEKVILKR